MKKLILGLAFALFSFGAHAEMFESGQGHLCSKGTKELSGAEEIVAHTSSSKYKELLVASSFSEARTMIYHWVVNIETGTWSVVREMPTGLACLTDVGTRWTRDGNTVIAILDPNAMLLKITITENGEWIVSVRADPESPLQIGVDGGSQWEWVAVPGPAGLRI